MVTIYDVFAKIVEKAPVNPKDLEFSTPINVHIKKLLKKEYIKKTEIGYIPIKNEITTSIFDIIKFSMKTGINHNIFFSKEMYNILNILNDNSPNLRPEKLKNNKNNLRIINFLELNQFILIQRNKPKIGTLLNHSIYQKITTFNKKEQIIINENLANTKDIESIILKSVKVVFNPFGNNYFEYITGSAQLEGSTVTIGETIEMLVNDIYPNKKHEEVQMIKNLNEAMNFIIENLKNPLTIDLIKEINKKVLFSLHKGAGILKKSENKIQGNPNFKTTPPHLVLKELNDFCILFNSLDTREKVLENIGKIHNELQKIHPFSDGNSRTTRLIVNWLLIKYDFSLLTLKTGSFEKYMSLTKLSKKRSDDDLRKFILNLLLNEYNQQN